MNWSSARQLSCCFPFLECLIKRSSPLSPEAPEGRGDGGEGQRSASRGTRDADRRRRCGNGYSGGMIPDLRGPVLSWVG